MIDRLLERDLLPDSLVRLGIRRLLAQRLREEGLGEAPEALNRRSDHFARELQDFPIAINTEDSRRQHYEVPTAFYEKVLGPRT